MYSHIRQVNVSSHKQTLIQIGKKHLFYALYQRLLMTAHIDIYILEKHRFPRSETILFFINFVQYPFTTNNVYETGMRHWFLPAGSRSLNSRAVDHSTVDHSTVDHSTVGQSTVGQSTVGQLPAGSRAGNSRAMMGRQAGNSRSFNSRSCVRTLTVKVSAH